MATLYGLLIGAIALTLPALAVRLTGAHLGTPPLEALIFGVAVLGSAFLLAWAAEVAQTEISQALALAGLALIAVLPEYAVDLYFAWQAATDPTYVSYATANMTGANRLLVGVAWPLVVLLAWLRSRRRGVSLAQEQRVEVALLGLATLYSFILPLKGSISLLDSLVLVGMFGAYVWRLSHLPAEEPHLVGPARLLGMLPRMPRRAATALLFAFSGAVIYLSAEPFAEALVHSGASLGVDEFLLVQWLAPLASEAPEVIVASMFALRMMAGAGLGALVSSKVNQWTLLIGTLPIAYTLAAQQVLALPLDGRQTEELLLTAAQSLLAVALLLNLRLALPGAGLLLALFLVQLLFPSVRLPVTAAYLLLAAAVLIARRREVVLTVQEGLLGMPPAHQKLSSSRAGHRV